jgi:hypothetical protein
MTGKSCLVGRGLEDREVAVVRVGESLLQGLQVLRDVVEIPHHPQDLLAAVPEQALDARAGAQVEVAQRE